MKKAGLFVFLFFVGLYCRASGPDSVKHKRIQVIPAPFFYYSPESRFGFGAGISVTFQLHRDTVTNFSEVFAVMAVTQNRQAVLYLPFDFYTKNNSFYYDGELGFYKYSYYYWGIGTERNNKELYAVKFPRLILNAYKKAGSNLYAGLDYNFEKDRIGKTQPGGKLDSDLVIGSDGFTVSGIGIDVLYDTRDNIFFPTKGWFIKALSYFNSPIIGASGSFSKIITNASCYVQVSNPVVLAFNEQNVFSWGQVPFNQLGLLGGSKQMRGYYLGYYRDNFLNLLQAEARIHLFGRWGYDIFSSVALLGHPGDFPTSNCPIFAEGMGLRYNANLKHHINIRGDVGYGNSLAFYLSVEEAF